LADCAEAWRGKFGLETRSRQKVVDFRRFSQLARSLLNCWRGRRMVRRPVSGRPTMTLSYSNLQSLAGSVIGAMLAASLFVSAAIGPVPIV
jgi:hypothetical protein